MKNGCESQKAKKQRSIELPVFKNSRASEKRDSASRERAAGGRRAHHTHLADDRPHYSVADNGQTVSPIEPSEAMYTLQNGAVNAGFIFFTLAILATLIFGRFVCGWGCHIVALQDFCAWLLKKIRAHAEAVSLATAGLCAAHRRALHVRLADGLPVFRQAAERAADSRSSPII